MTALLLFLAAVFAVLAAVTDHVTLASGAAMLGLILAVALLARAKRGNGKVGP